MNEAPPTRDPQDLEALLQRARALAPVVEAEARAAEQATTLTPKIVEGLRDSALLAAFLPNELGGQQRALPDLVRLVEEVARQDGSTGWCFGMNGIVGGICAAYLPDEGLTRVYSPGTDAARVLLAGGFPPQGRADREGDHWQVSAQMRFGSGIRHADFIACTVVEFAGEAPVMDGSMPRLRTFVVPHEQVRIEETWDVAGLEGTGSCDYFLDDARLPDELSFVSSTTQPCRGHGLYDLPLLSLASAPHAGFALGVGRRALDEIAAHATSRQRLASSAILAERPAFQRDFGRARTALDAARSLVLERFDTLDRAGRTAAGAGLAERAGATAAAVHAYEVAYSAAEMAFRAAGGAALFREGRLQRCFRDLAAGRQHIFATEEAWERVAQVFLGVGEPTMV